MRLLALLGLVGSVIPACANRTDLNGSTGNSDGGIHAEGMVSNGSCHLPAPVEVRTDPPVPGCFARSPAALCAVRNGATVNAADGGVSGGTESCASLCKASQYEMVCDPPEETPDPSLGCRVIPIPTPSCCLYYCCPCAD
jgi:hypothetical protein